MSKWEEIKIKDIGKVITGKTPSKNNPEYWGENFMFVTPTDFKNDSKYITKVGRGISNKGITALKKIKLPPNSILVSCIGSDMGKVAITTKESITNQQINSIIVEKDKFDADFIYYFLKYSYPTLKAYSDGGSTMPIINKSDFADLDLYIPKEKHMQSKIRKSLSSLDSKIELLRKQNQTLENIAQTLFKRWFIDFEFPNEDGKPYKSSGGKMVDSELGEIPEAWEQTSINSIINRITTKVGSDNQSNYKVLSAVKTGDLVLSEEYFTKQVFSKSISKYIIIEKYDFAYNPARINIGSIGKHEGNFKGAVSPVYIAFRCKEAFHVYVSLLLETSRVKKHIELLASGSVRQTLSYEGFGMIEIGKPCNTVLSTFNNIYENLKSKIDFNTEQIQSLTKTRDTLLPKLMSGQIRVKTND